jgi:diguanylate cyclase (GGDEF)-like protein
MRLLAVRPLRQGLGVSHRFRNGNGLEGREGSAAARLAREVSSLQTKLLVSLREELADADAELFADAAERLAESFGSVAATAIETLLERADGDRDPTTSLYGEAQMRRRLDQLLALHARYGHPFSLVLLDAEGPGAREGVEGAGPETVVTVVGSALRESIRLADEAFRLGGSALCVLAPNQRTVDGVQMAQRLARVLARREAAGGLRVTISAGVASCPEHGASAERLLREADAAMWRARSLGQPVGIGELQDR